MLRLVSLTRIVFADGSPSGSAEENAHSSSSAAGAGAGALRLAKSNMDGAGCCGVDCLMGEESAANGSVGCCLTAAACRCACIACCCWNSEGCGVVDWEMECEDPKAENEE